MALSVRQRLERVTTSDIQIKDEPIPNQMAWSLRQRLERVTTSDIQIKDEPIPKRACKECPDLLARLASLQQECANSNAAAEALREQLVEAKNVKEELQVAKSHETQLKEQIKELQKQLQDAKTSLMKASAIQNVLEAMARDQKIEHDKALLQERIKLSIEHEKALLAERSKLSILNEQALLAERSKQSCALLPEDVPVESEHWEEYEPVFEQLLHARDEARTLPPVVPITLVASSSGQTMSSEFFKPQEASLTLDLSSLEDQGKLPKAERAKNKPKSEDERPVNFRGIGKDWEFFKPKFAEAMKPFLSQENKEAAGALVTLHDAYFQQPCKSKAKEFDDALSVFNTTLKRQDHKEFLAFRERLGMGPIVKRTRKCN